MPLTRLKCMTQWVLAVRVLLELRGVLRDCSATCLFTYNIEILVGVWFVPNLANEISLQMKFLCT